MIYMGAGGTAQRVCIAAVVIIAGIVTGQLPGQYIGTEIAGGTLTGKLLTLAHIGVVILLFGGIALVWRPNMGSIATVTGVL